MTLALGLVVATLGVMLLIAGFGLDYEGDPLRWLRDSFGIACILLGACHLIGQVARSVA